MPSPTVEGVYYNKQVLASYGITTELKNFGELVANATKIKSPGGVPFFEMGGDKWATQWWVQVQLADPAKAGLWSRVNTGKEKLTDSTDHGAITTYQSQVKQGLFNKDITSATCVDQGKALLSDKAAMAMQVDSFFGELQASATTAELNEKIDFFPISRSGNNGTFIPTRSNALVRLQDQRQQA